MLVLTAALAVFTARYYSPHTHLCCVRVPREHVRMVNAAVTLVRFVQRHCATLSVVQTCGSSRTARRAVLKRIEECEARLGPDEKAARLELRKVAQDLQELQRVE